MMRGFGLCICCGGKEERREEARRRLVWKVVVYLEEVWDGVEVWDVLDFLMDEIGFRNGFVVVFIK